MLNVLAYVVAKGDRLVVIVGMSSVVDSLLPVVMSIVDTNSPPVVKVLSLSVLDSKVVIVVISVVITVVSGRLVR